MKFWKENKTIHKTT